MNTSEPFGLPPGTIRAVIALGFTAVTLFRFAMGLSVDDALFGISTMIIGNYFGARGSSNPVEHVAPRVEPPFIPGTERPE